MCQSMFCAIPCPCHCWEERARSKMLLFLPVIGLEIGLCWAGLGWLCRYLHLPQLMTGLVLALTPFLLTGFLHLDGFMDVKDAVGSCRDLQRRREILKDSHVGSFAVIGFGILLLSQFACASALKPQTDLRVLILIPILSRCCAGLAVDALPSMSTSQYAGRTVNKGHLVYFSILILALLILGFVLFGRAGLAVLATALGLALALRKAYKALEGMNGDISGYSITLGELAGLFVLALL